MSYVGIAWSYIKGAFSFSKSAKESVIDYVLGQVNKILEKPDLSKRIGEAYSVALKCSSILKKYSDWCPAKWKKEFEATVDAIDTLIDTFADGKVEAFEVVKVCDKFKTAYNNWMED